MSKPLFSICHTTARPNEWRAAYDAWLQAADRPDEVEYVLVCDRRWGFTELPQLRQQDKVAWNTGRKCLVDGANTACALADGLVLIISADDMFPQNGWDTAVDRAIASRSGAHSWQSDFVIQTSSGTPADERNNLVLQVLSRTRYQRLGYGLYPGYDGVFADDEFSAHAFLDGVVVNGKHITVEHRHPIFSDKPWDDVYKHENRPEAYREGQALFTARRAKGFPRD